MVGKGKWLHFFMTTFLFIFCFACQFTQNRSPAQIDLTIATALQAGRALSNVATTRTGQPSTSPPQNSTEVKPEVTQILPIVENTPDEIVEMPVNPSTIEELNPLPITGTGTLESNLTLTEAEIANYGVHNYTGECISATGITSGANAEECSCKSDAPSDFINLAEINFIFSSGKVGVSGLDSPSDSYTNISENTYQFQGIKGGINIIDTLIFSENGFGRKLEVFRPPENCTMETLFILSREP